MKRNVLAYIIMVSVMAVALSATVLPLGAQADGDVVAAIKADYPRAGGSYATLSLQRVIASTIHGIPWYWTFDGYTHRHQVIAVLTAEEMRRRELRERVQSINRIYHVGAGNAYSGLTATGDDFYWIGREFLLVTRLPWDEELAAAEEAGTTLDVRLVALDAFVFQVNTANPIDSLTLEQIQGIYSGAITSWTELGVSETIEDIPNDSTAFADEPVNFIHPYTQLSDSENQQWMDRLVMAGTQLVTSEHLLEVNRGDSLPAIAGDSRGIGYSVYSYNSFISDMMGTKLIGVEGVLPTPATIADGSYPLVTEVYAVVRADLPAKNPAVLLRDWLLTPDGQAVIASSGFVPLPKQ